MGLSFLETKSWDFPEYYTSCSAGELIWSIASKKCNYDAELPLFVYNLPDSGLVV